MSDFLIHPGQVIGQGPNEFWLFLLNKRVSISKKQLRMFTVKINASGSKSKPSLYFDCITESVPKVNAPNLQHDQKPAFFKVMPVLSVDPNSLDFYAYVGFQGAGHSAVFKFPALELSGEPVDEEESAKSDEMEIADEQTDQTKDKMKTLKPVQASPPSSVKEFALQNSPRPATQLGPNQTQQLTTPSPGLKELEDILQNDFNQMKALGVQSSDQKQTEPHSIPVVQQKKPTNQGDPAIVSQTANQTQKSKKTKTQQQVTQPVMVYKEKGSSPAAVQKKISSPDVHLTEQQIPVEKPRKQEQVLLESLADLTQKYADLHGRLNQLTQQIKTQKDLQIQVEQTVTRAVKASMPEMIKKQVEDTVTPLITKQAETLTCQINTSINSVLMPRVEQQIRSLFVNGNQDTSNQLQLNTIVQQQQEPTQTSQLMVQGINGDQIRKIVHHEFREAMSQQIVPELEKSLKHTLSQIREPLNAMNKALFEQLVSAETRSDYFVRRLDQQLSQQVLNLNHLQHQQHQYQQQQFQQQQQAQVQAQQPNFGFNNFNSNAHFQTAGSNVTSSPLPQQAHTQQQQTAIQYFIPQQQQNQVQQQNNVQQQPQQQAMFQPAAAGIGIFYPNAQQSTTSQQSQQQPQFSMSVPNSMQAPQQQQQTPTQQQIKFQPTQTVANFSLNQSNTNTSTQPAQANVETTSTSPQQTQQQPQFVASPQEQAQAPPQQVTSLTVVDHVFPVNNSEPAE